MDDLSPGARSLLRAAETHDDPSAEDAARVRRAVLGRVGAVGIVATLVTAGSAPAKAASFATIAGKLTAAVALTLGGVATFSYVSRSTEPAATTARAGAATGKPAPGRPTMPAPAEPPPTEVTVETEESPAAIELPRAPRPRTPRPGTPDPLSEKPTAPTAKPELSPIVLEFEMKLIRAADAAVRAGRSKEALSLLDQHEDEHARGSLAHEREGLRAIAQCQLSSPAAPEVAARFLERSPRSPLATRLRSACRRSDIGE